MSNIGAAIERLESAVARRQGFGNATNRSVTTCSAELRCATEEGPWSVVSDLGGALGGSDSAPSPGVLVRAALGSCMAMSYRLRAAKHGIELTSIRVTVETDSELIGMLSCAADAPPGYTEVRYSVEVDSPAPVDEVRRIIDEGDRLSPLLDVVVRANTVRRTTSIRSGED